LPVVDFHIHPLVSEVIDEDKYKCQREVFGLRTSPQPLETLLSQMQEASVERGVLLALDCSVKANCSLPSNEEVASIVKKYPSKFVGFGSLHPYREGSLRELLEEEVINLGLRGLKLNPSIQDFDPLSQRALQLYGELERLNLPLIVHTGLSWFPSTSLEYCKPLIWDNVARRFPNLKIVLSHLGWPWVWDAIAVALRNDNVFLDISNTFTGSPNEHLRYLLTELVPKRFVERFLNEKIIFGSDYPRIEIPKMVRALRGVGLKEEIEEAILRLNALKILGDEE